MGQQALDFTDVMLERGYDRSRAYAQSKLAQIMFTFDLADELDPAAVFVGALHPATYMATAMVREAGVAPWSTVEEGVEAVLHLLGAPARGVPSGRYFNGTEESRADAQAYDAQTRLRVPNSRRLTWSSWVSRVEWTEVRNPYGGSVVDVIVRPGSRARRVRGVGCGAGLWWVRGRSSRSRRPAPARCGAWMR
ncbi:hypothetical protein ACFV2X_19350 [Streptomyces sp. NPDC059679]|uniref:hypothetical protein n=1 Tax=Streptomyces sp. NPDC059679 TaxID=3346903 RepID=UPI0036CF74D1